MQIMIRNMSHVLLSDQHTLSPAVDEIVRLQLLGTNLLALTGNRVGVTARRHITISRYADILSIGLVFAYKRLL